MERGKTRARSAQAEPISLVLITGIVIALVGSAYFWGMPVIDKRSASADFGAATSMMSEVNKKIISLANAGGGKVDVDISKALKLVPYGAAPDPDAGEESNSLMFIYGVNQPMLSMDGAEGSAEGVVHIGSATFGDLGGNEGVFGQSSPGVITVSQERTELGTYILRTRLKYRELKATGTGTAGAYVKSYLIKLCEDSDLNSCGKKATGSSRITLTFRGTELIPGAPDRVVTKIGVKLS